MATIRHMLEALRRDLEQARELLIACDYYDEAYTADCAVALCLELLTAIDTDDELHDALDDTIRVPLGFRWRKSAEMLGVDTDAKGGVQRCE